MQLLLESFDDQVVINNALKKCSILWQKPNLHSYVYGMCKDLGVRVTLLPASAVCRRCMSNKQYYVWHQKGARRQEDKKRIAKEGGVWFLKWEQLDLDQSQLKGVEWLRYLYTASWTFQKSMPACTANVRTWDMIKVPLVKPTHKVND